MPKQPLTVVLSAGQSRNPEKRKLESDIAEAASKLPDVNVLQIPHLYDLAKKGETFAALQALKSNIVAITWLFDRAAHWILDRNGVQGQVGEVELHNDLGDEEPEQEETVERVTDSYPRPNRIIYTLDFRASSSAQEFVDEISRISASSPGDAPELPKDQLARIENPTNDTYVGAPTTDDSATLFGTSSIVALEEPSARRWYPVIDFSRCTNCMECIDFCLFGVYGVDNVDTILVDQPDNCRKGCPACSRVCPQNAIIFPQHKTPAIAGAPVDTGGMKIDLSKLFGAPESDEDAADIAARERNEQLILAGRDPVSANTGLSDRISQGSTTEKHPDELDNLLDQLDSLDL